MEERQSPKDGRFYRRVGEDQWEPVIKQSPKDGNFYQKVGEDAWELFTQPQPPEATASDKALAATEGLARSASMGTLPYLQAAGEVATDFAAEKLLGAPESSESFSDRVDRAKQRSEAIKEKAPGYALAGELAGFIAPGAGISKAVGAAGKAIPSVSRAAQALRAKGVMGKLAADGARLAAEGGLMGAAYTPETGFSDVEARLQAAGTGAAIGAVTPAALAATGKALSTAVKAPAWAGKKILSSIGGVSEDVIDRYIQNPERVRNAQSFDELYERVTKIVGEMSDDLDNAKIDADAAKAHLDDVATGIRESRIEGKEKALEQVRQAKSMLDEAFKSQKESLRQAANPSHIEPQVTDAIGKLKNQVSEGSKKSFEILGDEMAPATNALQDITKRVEALSARGSDAAKSAIPKLQDYGKRIFNAGQTDDAGNFLLSSKEIKRFIQDIDSDLGQWSRQTGAYDDLYTKELKGLRNALDEQLKASSPAYKEQMAKVAQDARLLSEASRRFGDPGRAASRMANLERPSAKVDKETLMGLAAREGDDLTQSIQNMTKAQRTLQSPTRMDAVRQSLPESQSLRQAEMQAASAKRLAKPKAIKEVIQKSAAQFKNRSAQEKLKAQKELFNKFKTWGEQGAEAKLQQVARGKKYATAQLEELSKLSDEDFVEAVRAASDAAQFEKRLYHGSKGVNVWAALGMAAANTAVGKAGVGAAAGGAFGGTVGLALGAVTGALMDQFGPRVTKKILDGIVKMKGPLSASAITKMDIPPKAKDELIKAMRSALVAERSANASKEVSKKLIGEREQEYRGKEKWARQGLDKIMQDPDPAKVARYKELREKLLSSRKGKDLLSQISSLRPGTKAYENAVKQLEVVGGGD